MLRTSFRTSSQRHKATKYAAYNKRARPKRVWPSSFYVAAMRMQWSSPDTSRRRQARDILVCEQAAIHSSDRLVTLDWF
jgi:hypothetical protein